MNNLKPILVVSFLLSRMDSIFTAIAMQRGIAEVNQILVYLMELTGTGIFFLKLFIDIPLYLVLSSTVHAKEYVAWIMMFTASAQVLVIGYHIQILFLT